VAIAAWNVTFVVPVGGMDQSWFAGMHMVAQMGLHFGTQVIWTYGPLSFLFIPGTYYSGLAVLAFCYQALLLVAYCTSLVWALRRSANAVVAVAVAFVTVLALPNAFTVLVIAAVWCLAALDEDPARYATRLVSIGGGALSALQFLIRLSWGPAIFLMCAATLMALPGRRRDLPIFVGTAAATFAALWLAAGQRLGDVPHFLRNAMEIVGGYSQAMGIDTFAGKYLVLAIATLVLLVACSALAAPAGPRRVAAGAVTAVAGFIAYKEGAVRFDVFHVIIFFATAAPLLMVIRWRGRLRLVGVAAVLAVGALAVHVAPANTVGSFNPVTHVKTFVTQVRTLASPARRRHIMAAGRFWNLVLYRVEPSTVALLRGHRVHVDPWAASVVWAYNLDWRPLPVFQDYQAYTSRLDAANARVLRSPSDGPDRILRENVPLIEPRFRAAAIDDRYPAWDPPQAAIAMLCNFAPLQTTQRWQVLGRTRNRCGAPRLLRSVNTRYGASIPVPQAAPGEAVFARVHGAGVSGIETLRALLFRARFRYVTVNGRQISRLVPGTAADGLLMSVPKSADFPGAGFALSPAARTLSFTGTSGSLHVDFYAMPLRRF